jgi:hypothetical protein
MLDSYLIKTDTEDAKEIGFPQREDFDRIVPGDNPAFDLALSHAKKYPTKSVGLLCLNIIVPVAPTMVTQQDVTLVKRPIREAVLWLAIKAHIDQGETDKILEFYETSDHPATKAPEHLVRILTSPIGSQTASHMARHNLSEAIKIYNTKYSRLNPQQPERRWKGPTPFKSADFV